METSKFGGKSCSYPERDQIAENYITNWDSRGDNHVDVSKNHLDIVEVRRIGPQSVLLKWKPNQNLRVDGYEICSNGTVLSRVFSASRRLSVIDDIKKSPITLEVYAMHNKIRYEPPSIVEFALESIV